MVIYISLAKKTIDLCIFSFTNDDLANEIIKAHQRGVTVRIITDDEAMKGKGADAQRCSDKGIPVRTDSEEKYHMHNKFMIVDSLFLVTGSFNWTFQAGKSNQENVVVIDGDYRGPGTIARRGERHEGCVHDLRPEPEGWDYETDVDCVLRAVRAGAVPGGRGRDAE